MDNKVWLKHLMNNYMLISYYISKVGVNSRSCYLLRNYFVMFHSLVDGVCEISPFCIDGDLIYYSGVLLNGLSVEDKDSRNLLLDAFFDSYRVLMKNRKKILEE